MSDFETKYPVLSKFLVESAVSTPKRGWVFARLKKYKVIGGKQVYKGMKYDLLYVWDGTHEPHGHWEVYSKTGKPLWERLNGDSGKREDAKVIYYRKKENRRRLNV